jgi:hypothetical protein
MLLTHHAELRSAQRAISKDEMLILFGIGMQTEDRGSSCLINKTMDSTPYVCQDLNELNMKMLFTM